MIFAPFAFQQQVSTTPAIVTSGLQLYLDAGITASYPGTGTTWNDISGNGNNLTLTNGPVWSSSDGGYFTFDGTNDYVSNWTYGTTFSANEFTYQVVLSYSGKTAYNNIFDTFNSANPMMWVDPNNKLELNQAALVSALAYNTQNIMVTFVQQNANPGLRLYVNDTLVGTVTTAQGTIPNSRLNFFRRENSGQYFQGRAYSVLVYNKVLTSTEITQNFNLFKTRINLPNPVPTNLVLNYDAGITSSYPGTGTSWFNLQSTTLTSTLTNGPTFSTNNGGTIVFDGTNDFTTAAANSIFTFNTGDFAIEMWIKINGNSSTNNDGIREATICGCFSTSGGVTNTWSLQILATSSTTGTGLGFACRNAAGTFQNSTLTYSFTQGVFYQVGISHIGGVTKLFINGVSYTPSINLTNNINNTTLPFKIGALGYDGYLQYFNGTVGITRIYKGGGLTSEQITQNYNANSNRI
jgi:hypothetical protein